MKENLPELRDIHLPDDILFWPFSYGWWLIILFFFLTILLLQTFLFIYRRSKKIYAIKLLDNIISTDVVNSAKLMSEILRRICVYKYKEAVSLKGSEWLDFLNSHSNHKLEGKEADLLINSPYIPKDKTNYTAVELDKLKKYIRQWIGENL